MKINWKYIAGGALALAFVLTAVTVVKSQQLSARDEIVAGSIAGIVDGIVGDIGNIFGALSSPDVFQHTYFHAGSTDGGRVATTSTAATYTTAASDFKGLPTYIDWLPNVDTTVSINGTSTYAYIPNVGDVAKIYFRNASTTAGATITFAALDSGVDIQDNEDSADLALNGLDYMEVTLIRESTYLVSALLQEYTEAD